MKPLLLFFAIALCGMSVIPASAQEDCNTLNYWWSSKYYWDFHVAWPLEKFTCPSDAARIAKAFYDLEHSSAGVTGAPNFYGYVSQRIKRITFSSTPHPSGFVATVDKSGLMALYPPYVASGSDAWRATTLFHEARHVDSDDPAHVTCTRGAFTGHPGSCDEIFDSTRLTQLGAYNYGFYFLWWLRDHPGLVTIAPKDITDAMGSIVYNNVNQISAADLKKFGNGGRDAFPVLPQM